MARRRTRRGGKQGWVRRHRFGLVITLVLVLLVGAYAAVLEFSRPHVSGDDLRFDTFVQLAGQDRIRDARILDQDAYIVGDYVRGDGSVGVYNAPLIRGTQGDLASLLVEQGIPTTVDQQVLKRVVVLASYLLPMLILVLLFAYLIVSYRRGSGLFGIRSGARQVAQGETGATFADVAGQDAAVAELRDVKEFLADPGRFTVLGAEVPKGVLLYGPPGCGKTLLARALAGEAGAAFFETSGSDFVELYVGVGAARVRDLFRQAREAAPAVVFIDELDAIGRSRGRVGTTQSSGEQEQALNQILAEMDGFTASDGVLVVAATNRPDVLDPALLRPGRFDRSVGLEQPDEAARRQILALHAAGKRLAADVDLAAVARRAVGLTGADLAAVLNDAALLAGRAGKTTVGQAELDSALQRLLEAPERQRRLSLRSRSVGKRFAAEERVTFADVAGADDAVAELVEVTGYLSNPDRYLRLGARVPRGVLLSGPPGVGKTLLAKAVAGEANAAFLSVAGSEFVEVFVGEGAARVRDLFAEAKAMAPAIVFVDEIDAIGGRRAAGALDGQREREATLNQILVELDGFDERAAVIVIAATNRPDILDPALVRPGRFDRRIAVSLPDRAGRRAILALHAAGKRLGADVDLDAVAALTAGFSGADLANALNEAALLAGRQRLAAIPMTLVEEGVDRALSGIASHATVLSEDERRVVAYHEAGHALVALRLEHAAPPHKLTIATRGHMLGSCRTLDGQERNLRTRAALIDHMAVALAGRIAEQETFGDLTSGSSSDLRMAAETARWMVCELGMGETLGARPVTVDAVDLDGRRRNLTSADRARAVETDIDALIATAEDRARGALADRATLQRVAEVLLERETVTAAELAALDTTPLKATKRTTPLKATKRTTQPSRKRRTT